MSCESGLVRRHAGKGVGGHLATWDGATSVSVAAVAVQKNAGNLLSAICAPSLQKARLDGMLL